LTFGLSLVGANDPSLFGAGISSAPDTRVKLEKIQDFEVWKKAEAFADAVTAILRRPAFSKNCKLLGQIEEALESISSNMSEGFEQSTDRGFARYLYISKGSTAETLTRLAGACRRECLTKDEVQTFEKQAEEILQMLSGLIRHLMKTPDRRRGLGPSCGTDRTKTDKPKRRRSD
jgi:four helix bundle protein